MRQHFKVESTKQLLNGNSLTVAEEVKFGKVCAILSYLT